MFESSATLLALFWALSNALPADNAPPVEPELLLTVRPESQVYNFEVGSGRLLGELASESPSTRPSVETKSPVRSQGLVIIDGAQKQSRVVEQRALETLTRLTRIPNPQGFSERDAVEKLEMARELEADFRTFESNQVRQEAFELYNAAPRINQQLAETVARILHDEFASHLLSGDEDTANEIRTTIARRFPNIEFDRVRHPPTVTTAFDAFSESAAQRVLKVSCASESELYSDSLHLGTCKPGVQEYSLPADEHRIWAGSASKLSLVRAVSRAEKSPIVVNVELESRLSMNSVARFRGPAEQGALEQLRALLKVDELVVVTESQDEVLVVTAEKMRTIDSSLTVSSTGELLPQTELAPPTPWYRSPWLWAGVAVVGGAVAVTFALNSSRDGDGPTPVTVNVTIP